MPIEGLAQVITVGFPPLMQNRNIRADAEMAHTHV
jgi:hypothetical protein